MNLSHLSFVGGLRPHCPPPPPPTAEERLSAFRAAWPAASANTWPWKWREGELPEQANQDMAAPTTDALRISRDLLRRIAGKTLPAARQAA
ncbi:MAG: hypothetical protein QM761_12770 [Pseudoxanthomonas sp.]